ncbi:DNA primase [Chitinimonas sp. BJYL2]|uniref:DNA primase n=1 Tax=Chitinimonas sp. BJYL2 TaxID=2976696 RepID=UPI0022B3621B|nr:DNA primase [Chitinimonas sp. BJYL2]
MALIPEEFVQDLLNRLDIVEVVERYLPLKKTGQNYSACCPFHKEKSPSFTVSPTKQFYHCFGCGVNGSAVRFVMEYEGLAFPEAVEKLAESVGMQVPRVAGSKHNDAPQRARQASLVELNKAAMQFYRDSLKQSPAAIDYLKRRGLSGQIAARFGLGYAPEDWHPLASCFSDYATNPGIKEVGLVIDSESTGRRYDRFRNRIMFPILDGKSQVIGFGGRVLDSAASVLKGQSKPDAKTGEIKEPKYLNSPETPLFQKGLELYGLPQARQAIRTLNRVLVVEGYMDVVGLAQLGVEYAVATLGTACTPEHVRKLMRLADRTIFCFDGDAAGRKAAWRALENSLPLASDAKTLSFLFLPSEHDPDSYIRAFGKEAFETFADEESLGLAAFLCRELSSQVDLDTEEGKARLLHLAKPLVEQIKAPALAILLRKKLGELAGLDTYEVTQILGISQPLAAPATKADDAPRRQDSPRSRAPRDKESRYTPRQSQPSLGRAPRELGFELLQLLVLNPKLALELPQSALPAITDPGTRAIARVVDYVCEASSPPASGHLMEALRGDPSHALLAKALAAGQLAYATSSESTLHDVWRDVLERYLQRADKPRNDERIAELAAKGFAGMSSEEREEYSRLLMAGRHI